MMKAVDGNHPIQKWREENVEKGVYAGPQGKIKTFLNRGGCSDTPKTRLEEREAILQIAHERLGAISSLIIRGVCVFLSNRRVTTCAQTFADIHLAWNMRNGVHKSDKATDRFQQIFPLASKFGSSWAYTSESRAKAKDKSFLSVTVVEVAILAKYIPLSADTQKVALHALKQIRKPSKEDISRVLWDMKLGVVKNVLGFELNAVQRSYQPLDKWLKAHRI